jgi:hypothetical protein
MPTPAIPLLPPVPPENSNPADTRTLPVASRADVVAEWSPDVMGQDAAPVRDAIIDGETAMLLAYQNFAAAAAAQSDPLAATDEYLELIAGDEFATYKQPGETDGSLRTRMLAARATVSPAAIVAAANAILAPYTAVSAKYFEHLDAWCVRNGPYYDVIAATATTPIVITPRFGVPLGINAGDSITTALIAGIAAANGTFPVAIVMGPVVPSFPGGTAVPPTVTISGTPTSSTPVLLAITTGGTLAATFFTFTTATATSAPLAAGTAVALGTTGLSATFSAGTYAVGMQYSIKPSGLSLNGTVGIGGYTGGGSLSLALDKAPWSSHVFGPNSFQAPGYPDRLYGTIPNRFPRGARVFSSPYGRIFWLQVPEISGIDENVAGLYSWTTTTRGSAAPNNGFFLGPDYTLPGTLVIGPGLSGTLDATHSIAIVDSTNNVVHTTAFLPNPAVNKQQAAVFDSGGHADRFPIYVFAGLNTMDNPIGNPGGGPINGITIAGARSFTIWQFNSGTSNWDLIGLNGSFLWNISVTAFQVYDAIVGAVDQIRGQSMRWQLWVEPAMGA